ncbi:MAG: redoxin domain-containing protein [Flavobacteriia bacterium]|jgi:peroxiredoxin
MLRKLYIPLFIFVLLSFKGEKEFAIGDVAPLSEVKMKNIDSKELSLKTAVGKKGLLVVFSCNTCPFVVGNENFAGWEKQYNEIYDLAQKLEINMILVNSNEAKRDGDDSFDKMKEHAKELNYKMPYLVDENSQLANEFAAKTTPHAYLLDSSLKLVYKGSIDNSWDTKKTETLSYVKNALQELKENKTITTNKSEPRGCSIKRK